MKASELIVRLNGLIEKHGDLNVLVWDREYSDFFDANSIVMEISENKVKFFGIY